MLAPPEPWEPRPVPRVRIPGFDGSVVVFEAAANGEGAAAGHNAIGVNVLVATPERAQTWFRLPVSNGFPERLATFLSETASHLGAPGSVQQFVDADARIAASVEQSNDFTVVLRFTITSGNDTDQPDETSLFFIPTSRAALITCAEEAEAFKERRESEEFPFRAPKTGLPLDLLSTPSEKRLTGIYRSGVRLTGDEEFLFVSHYVRLTEGAQGDVEASLIASRLPFCEVALYGVYSTRNPWVLITQLIPIHAQTDIAKHWDPIDIARDDLHAALDYAATDAILGEGIATRDTLLQELTRHDIPMSLVADWETGDLALASIARVANIPLKQIAVGRLTGCAFPDVEHDCPKDVFDCAFSRWQELWFASLDQDE